MRILYGITKSNWGGAQRYVYDLAVAAQEAGHEVAVLCGGEGALVENLEKAGIRIIPLSNLERDVRWKADLKSFWQILETLKREKPDVFHINSSKMGAMGALAGRIIGVKKIIFTAHGWAFNEPRHWAQKLVIEEVAWLTVLLAEKTICVSEMLKRQMEKKPLISGKLVVVHNGLKEFRLLPRAKARMALAPDASEEALIIGTLAELHRIKGLDIAIRGFSRSFKYTDERLIIVGEGEERRSLEELVAKLGLDNQVRLAGFKPDARELLKGFDIFVLPSRSEGLPYALLEAGLAALPVVASRVGGIPEVIRNGENGILVASERPEEFAKAFLDLKDANFRKTLGKNLHDTIMTGFSAEKMVEETFNQY